MANHNDNGRNVNTPDENRPSWRAHDQTQHSRAEDDRPRDDDRQGQSGYGAGWSRDDRNRVAQPNQRGGHGDPQGVHTDDRFTGRGGHWTDRGGYGARGEGYRSDRTYDDSRDVGPRRDFGPTYGADRGTYGQGAGQNYGHNYGQGWQNRGTEDRPGLHRGKGPKGYVRSDDRIKEAINEALTDDDRIDASHIEVVVKNGDVTLTGFVEDRQTKRAAEDLVERMAGVKDVQNQLRMQSNRSGDDAVGKHETEMASTSPNRPRA